MTTGHDEQHVLVAAYVLDSLEADERRAFEEHLSSCAACASDMRSLAPVVVGLARAVPSPHATPSPALRNRIVEATRPPRAAAPRTPSTLTWLRIAAMLLLTVGIGTIGAMGAYVTRLRVRVADLESRLDRATQQAAMAQTAMADARRVSFENQSAMAVLAAPDLARIDLAGQPDAPQAGARALWSRARGMVFTATGLPALPSGKVYQVWVVTAQAPISAGLLVPDVEGRGVAVFRTPPDIPAPLAVAVTIEPAGGVPAPTGAKYLVGVV